MKPEIKRELRWLSDRIYLKTKIVDKNKERHCTTIRDQYIKKM